MANGQALVSPRYQFNPSTGVLTFQNSATPINDQLKMIVYSSDSNSGCAVNPPDAYKQEIPISVITTCGQNSANCVSPTLQTISRASNAQSPQMSLSSTFSSSNPACPVTSMSLTNGASSYTINYNNQ